MLVEDRQNPAVPNLGQASAGAMGNEVFWKFAQRNVPGSLPTRSAGLLVAVVRYVIAPAGLELFLDPAVRLVSQLGECQQVVAAEAASVSPAIRGAVASLELGVVERLPLLRAVLEDRR